MTVRSEIRYSSYVNGERFWSIVEDARAEMGSDSERVAATGAPFTVDGPPGLYEPLGTPVDLTDEANARRQFPRLAAYLDDNRWIPRPREGPAD